MSTLAGAVARQPAAPRIIDSRSGGAPPAAAGEHLEPAATPGHASRHRRAGPLRPGCHHLPPGRLQRPPRGRAAPPPPSPPAWGAGLLLALYLLNVNIFMLLLGGGVVFSAQRLAGRRVRRGKDAAAGTRPAGLVALPLGASGAGAVLVAPFSQLTLFLTFLKIGAVLYGSGYVLLAFLRTDFVEQLHWLTDRQLLDAVSIGQLTPGPVFTTATFIGYLVGGWQGALVATLGIFLPAFVFIPLLHRLTTLLRRSPWTAAALDGVNIAALALMAGSRMHSGFGAIASFLDSARLRRQMPP